MRKSHGLASGCVVAIGLLLHCAAAHAATAPVTGANSGIGLEFTKQYAAKGWDVIATHRREEAASSYSCSRPLSRA